MNLASFLFAVASLFSPPAAEATLQRTTPWDAKLVETIASLPVQHDGRVKPFVSLAAFTLYFVHGRRDMKLDQDGDGRPDLTLSPTEWLLDVWCFPDQAADYPLFRIENVEVLDAIGIEHGGQRLQFEFVSYRQMLSPGSDGHSPAQRLMDLAAKYNDKEPKDRSGVEQHLVHSAEQLNVYHALHQQLAVLHGDLPLEGDDLRAVFTTPGLTPPSAVTLADLLAKGPAFAEFLRQHGDQRDAKGGNGRAIAEALGDMLHHGGLPGLFPPARADADQWLGLGELADASFAGPLPANTLAALRSLQHALHTNDSSQRGQSLLAFRTAVVEQSRARGEFRSVELEAYYQEASWHYRALHWFLFALLVVAIGWLAPRVSLLWWAGMGLTTLSLCFLITDVVLRCVVRQRPPITNLYDTFLFIAGVGVLAAIVTEAITRRRIALSVAPLFGALLIVLARKFEVMDGHDTLAPLVAVLDTNYYLATHVTSINMGYAAGMMAAALGTVWLLLQALGVKRNDAGFHKAIVRMTYGVSCFGLIFAVFGTIYGGVWANDSWGRFWGWDPKENGALMICLAQVALLHARMSGLVRDMGFCVWAALTGIVVAFSWFHVNLLGVGLHSYGFAAGLKTGLFTYYGSQALLVLASVGAILLRRRLAHASSALGVVAGAHPSP